MPARLDEPWYDADHEVRCVRPAGEIKLRIGLVFIGEAFAGELVGLAELDGGGQIVRFTGRDLGHTSTVTAGIGVARSRARGGAKRRNRP